MIVPAFTVIKAEGWSVGAGTENDCAGLLT